MIDVRVGFTVRLKVRIGVSVRANVTRVRVANCGFGKKKWYICWREGLQRLLIIIIILFSVRANFSG